MYLSIIILPLLGSIVSGFFGRKVGVTGSRILGCLSIMTTTILAITSFFEVGFNNNPVSINLFKWLDNESFNMVWNFQFDSLTVSMLIPVLIISSLVHFYSIGYMSHDPHNQRFFSYLSLFTFMMIILVTGNNYLVMFVGWEGVGVCSYLLVSFWFTRIAANQSSLSAFLTNRVGDAFLMIGMFILLWTLGNLDYSTVFSLAPYINENITTIVGICLLIGAMAKSSQVGLHIWLPMAMEGPTPVSALIHAATMVTAGVYLLIRSSPLIEYSTAVLLICLWLGAVTTVFSSLIGLFQQDIKKIIAYSTMSQLLNPARECSNIHSITFRHQTICVKPVGLNEVGLGNSQITKAHDCYELKRSRHINYNLFNSLFIYWVPYLCCILFVFLFLTTFRRSRRNSSRNRWQFRSNEEGWRTKFLILWIRVNEVSPAALIVTRWKIIIISKLVGISEAIRLILIFVKLRLQLKFLIRACVLIKNSFIINKYILKSIYLSALVTLSKSKSIHNIVFFNPAGGDENFVYDKNKVEEAPTNFVQPPFIDNNKDLSFNQWLAGLIDGNGHFKKTKKRYTSFEITMEDKKVLTEIKKKYGGSIKSISNACALRYKLTNKKGLISLISDVNGLLRNPTRLLQMNKLCVKFDIELKYSKPLNFDNGWLSGIIDSDGSVYYNEASGQVYISITQKNRYLLEPLIHIYSGKIDILSPKIEAFKYIIFKKKELYHLIDNYFNKHPLKTLKMKRVNLIKEFYNYSEDKNSHPQKLNDWVKFKDRWEKYKD